MLEYTATSECLKPCELRQTPFSFDHLIEWVGDDPDRAEMLVILAAVEHSGLPYRLIALGLRRGKTTVANKYHRAIRGVREFVESQEEKSRGGSIPERPAE